MNNSSQIAPTKLTLWSINFSAPEGNGSILILQTILTGTRTRCSTAASELRSRRGGPRAPRAPGRRAARTACTPTTGEPPGGLCRPTAHRKIRSKPEVQESQLWELSTKDTVKNAETFKYAPLPTHLFVTRSHLQKRVSTAGDIETPLPPRGR